MSIRLELPQYHTADLALREVYAYLTRTVDRLNYALSFLDVPEPSASAAIDTSNADRTATISADSTNAQVPSAKAVYDYAVPKTRTVNGHELADDVALTPAELGEAAFVIGTGNNDAGWEWRYWSDGTVELWGTGVEVSLGTAAAWTTETVYMSGSIAYPAILQNAEKAHVHVQLVKPDGKTEINGALIVANKTTAGATIRLVRKASTSRCYVDVYVRGEAAQTA